jgi:hypothetical protein
MNVTNIAITEYHNPELSESIPVSFPMEIRGILASMTLWISYTPRKSGTGRHPLSSFPREGNNCTHGQNLHVVNSPIFTVTEHKLG